ncbi:MAG: response regulator transcription factor [Bacteroidales bacterium]|nr:response regulator transcription factor [Bacteroidales bacterium]
MLKYTNLPVADILLLDIDMPELNGMEVAKLVNQKNPNLKIIAVTMYEDNLYLKELVLRGFKGFVSKKRVTKNLYETIIQVQNNNYVFPDIIKMI